MTRVERNLYLHENGNYYAIFDGVPRSLGTKKISEARRLLSEIRRERVIAADSKSAVSPVAIGMGAPEAPSSSSEMAELKAMLASLTIQVAQLTVGGRPVAALDGPVLAGGTALSFERFTKENLVTACATVKKKTQTMYEGGERRLMKTIRIYQRFERFKAFKATGAPAICPDAWEIFRRLGPGGLWGFWANKKVKLGPSGLNHFRCYLRQFVEDAVDRELLKERYLRLVEKIKMQVVDPDVPTVPSLEDMDSLLKAVRSVDDECGRLTEFIAVTGLRPGAFEELEWKDVNLPARLMSVAQDGLRPPVDISDQAMELLIEIKGDRVAP